MKILVLLITFLSGSSFAGEIAVPDTVKQALQTLYPGAQDVEWEAEGDNFEAEFTFGDKDMEVLFDKNGTVLEEESENIMDEDKDTMDDTDDDEED